MLLHPVKQATMPKPARQALITELLRQGPVENQGQLLDALFERGVQANQATISRDLRELGVAKTPRGYVLPGETPDAPVGVPHLDGAYAVSPAANLVVLRTAPGLASRIGLELDAVRHPEIVGTVAGDDTVFVATGGNKQAQQLTRWLRDLIQSRPARAGA